MKHLTGQLSEKLLRLPGRVGGTDTLGGGSQVAVGEELPPASSPSSFS